ncbi:ribosomal RNA large subunit methyltransferase J [Lentinula aff. detonsa]|uniref:rRNA methyltransferase 2, mitochondrial n=1 Tax=Lentinula aff. detonsa TaxID=2804958 RepID=A0AA38NMM2_9AGAR|nr:ribosomal RNA large subunit methyltransferase J [Lentinula aff. detonsa]KAJ3795916.1 ribosomal RNA large subunit methyltransferase J [Lentinula aff. detonsa]
MPLKLPFTPSFPSFSAKTKKSSTEWLRRQSQDPFVKQRSLGADITSTKTSSILGPSISSPLTFRSRSAFKLIEIHEKYDEFLLKPDVRVVVDLGAAPGGWSQVVSQLKSKKYKPTSLSPKPLDSYDPLNIDAELGLFSLSTSSPTPLKVKTIAVDRLSMDPIPGVYTLKADFLHPQTEDMIRALIDDFSHNSQKLTLATPDTPKVDVILSDIAPNITGVPTVDSEANFQVAQAVLQFAYKYLRTGDEIGRVRGGVLLLKHFAHPQMDQFRREVLERYFRDVIYTKPRASRQESKEGYFLCRGFWPKEYR